MTCDPGDLSNRCGIVDHCKIRDCRNEKAAVQRSLHSRRLLELRGVAGVAEVVYGFWVGARSHSLLLTPRFRMHKFVYLSQLLHTMTVIYAMPKWIRINYAQLKSIFTQPRPFNDVLTANLSITCQ